MKNIKYFAEQFLNDHVAIVDFPYIENLINPLLGGFNLLLEKNREELKKWQIHFPEYSKLPDHGLIFPKGEGYDEKWVFMYRTGLLADYFRLSRISQNDYLDYHMWFNVLHQAHRLLHSLVSELAGELDSYLPGCNLLQQVQDPSVEDMHALRFVKYIYGNPNETTLAKPHFDLGFITAQGYASHPGLDFIPNYREGLPKEEWNRISYPQKKGKIALFPGKKFAKATNDVIPAMYHEVTDVCGENREALIFFSHTAVPSEELR